MQEIYFQFIFGYPLDKEEKLRVASLNPTGQASTPEREKQRIEGNSRYKLTLMHLCILSAIADGMGLSGMLGMRYA